MPGLHKTRPEMLCRQGNTFVRSPPPSVKQWHVPSKVCTSLARRSGSHCSQAARCTTYGGQPGGFGHTRLAVPSPPPRGSGQAPPGGPSSPPHPASLPTTSCLQALKTRGTDQAASAPVSCFPAGHPRLHTRHTGNSAHAWVHWTDASPRADRKFTETACPVASRSPHKGRKVRPGSPRVGPREGGLAGDTVGGYRTHAPSSSGRRWGSASPATLEKSQG